MNFNKTIIPILTINLLASSCEEHKMEWETPSDYNKVTSAEIPLGLAEKIANYKNIKEYIAEYVPHMTLGLGIGADYYMDNETVKQLADANFQMYTTGNAMKHEAVVTNSGKLNFATIDAFRHAVPTDIQFYGHNFLWHTQQNQTYLKSLIAPKMIIQSDSDIANQLVGDNTNFNGGTTGDWTSWGNNKKEVSIAQGAGKDDTDCIMLANNADGNFWEAQLAYTFSEVLQTNKPYIIRFKAKSTSPAGALQFQYQNSNTNESQGGYYEFNIGNEWTDCEYEFTIADYDDVDRILLNFGKINGCYYIDDIEFGLKNEKTSPVCTSTRGTIITYKMKTLEEKRMALEGAMETWIKGMFEHIAGDNRFVGWDVINEPIADNNYQWRGIGNVFDGTDEDGNPDAVPVENETDGLHLNWAKGHFYWGYYLGKDYACKAFELARKYAPENMKLYVNDYNLETSPGKLYALIEFVKYIDENNATGLPLVDGIGTQMHVVSNITKNQVDAMFTALAATGKLVRITELDVRIGYEPTANPSAEQLMMQADTYKMIIESYIANVPKAQQSGITIWGLSDHADEHVYWHPGDTPNLFDANYVRKPAYKGVCDGLAGRDISEDFTGEDWENAYNTDTEETPEE